MRGQGVKEGEGERKRRICGLVDLMLDVVWLQTTYANA